MAGGRTAFCFPEAGAEQLKRGNTVRQAADENEEKSPEPEEPGETSASEGDAASGNRPDAGASSGENYRFEDQIFGEEKLKLEGSSIISGKGGIFGGKSFVRRNKAESIY